MRTLCCRRLGERRLTRACTAGARIVTATITALVKENGMGSSGGPERLLFAGCSAGGRGVLSNLDAVAAAVPTNVQVQGLVRP